MVYEGVNLRKIKAYQMLSEVLPDISPEEDFCIGQTLFNARHNKVGEIVENKLISLNFDFTKKRATQTRKAVEEVKINEV